MVILTKIQSHNFATIFPSPRELFTNTEAEQSNSQHGATHHNHSSLYRATHRKHSKQNIEFLKGKIEEKKSGTCRDSEEVKLFKAKHMYTCDFFCFNFHGIFSLIWVWNGPRTEFMHKFCPGTNFPMYLWL